METETETVTETETQPQEKKLEVTTPSPSEISSSVENKENPEEKEKEEKECPPWHKNTFLLMALIGLFLLALLFMILYFTKKTKVSPEIVLTVPVCPTPPSQEERPSCPKPSCPKPEPCPSNFNWQIFKTGLGSTEWGDPGFPVQITLDTDTLEKAQEWVRKQRGISLSYPYPVHASNVMFYSFAPYTQTTPDDRYQSYLFE